MKLSILIPCVATRNHRPLINSLCDALGIASTPDIPRGNNDVEILTDSSNRTSGAKRQSLLEASKGDYICYLDDDDTVSSKYISSILQGTSSGSDVISFNLQFKKDGRNREIWKFGLYPNHRNFGLMQANHLCAWRRSIATKVAWCPDLGRSDDHLWFEPLHAAKLVKTCFYIDDVLYHYWYSTYHTINQNATNNLRAQTYLKNGIRFFFYNHEIMVEVPGKCQDDHTKVRDHNNTVHEILTNQLTEFHKYKL